MRREKVVIAQVVAMVMSALTLLVALDVVSLSGEQLAQTEEALAAILTVVIPLLLSLWSRRQTTPVSDPQIITAAGKRVRLVPEENSDWR